MSTVYREKFQQCMAWLTREQHRTKARELRDGVNKAFTEHPNEAGETYPEHLWFTITISARFFYIAVAILIHGIFPFLLPRTGSTNIEKANRIIKERASRSPRTARSFDPDYHV